MSQGIPETVAEAKRECGTDEGERRDKGHKLESVGHRRIPSHHGPEKQAENRTARDANDLLDADPGSGYRSAALSRPRWSG